MDLGNTIKKIREKKGLSQKQVAAMIGMSYTPYNKMENGIREPSIAELQKLAKLFDMSIDKLLNFDETELPKEVSVEDKSTTEQLMLIAQLNEKDKTTILNILETMLTKKKFQDFFEQNIAK